MRERVEATTRADSLQATQPRDRVRALHHMPFSASASLCTVQLLLRVMFMRMIVSI